ncbi:MAG: transaldolase, partial [Acidobacteriota bacterium]
MREKPMDGIQAFLGELDGPVRERVASLHAMRFSDRLRRKDPTLWKDEPEHRKVISSSLGWVDVVGKMEENLQGLADFASELRGAGFTHVVHMGMGGSSLAPLAFLETFGASGNGLALTVLDTTDPATVLDVKDRVPLEKTLFIEASKSGSTVESRSFGEYFYKQLQEIKGEKAGDHFAVITDPGSMLMKLAQDRSYRRIFLNYSDIGGRYSALSYFGLVPAALMGMDVRKLLDSARRMVDACAPEVPTAENPGVYMGAVMGEL